jgi:hypothetical protein
MIRLCAIFHQLFSCPLLPFPNSDHQPFFPCTPHRSLLASGYIWGGQLGGNEIIPIELHAVEGGEAPAGDTRRVRTGTVEGGRPRGDVQCVNKSMLRPDPINRISELRHRQTKGAASDRLGLRDAESCSLLSFGSVLTSLARRLCAVDILDKSWEAGENRTSLSSPSGRTTPVSITTMYAAVRDYICM